MAETVRFFPPQPQVIENNCLAELIKAAVAVLQHRQGVIEEFSGGRDQLSAAARDFLLGQFEEFRQYGEALKRDG